MLTEQHAVALVVKRRDSGWGKCGARDYMITHSSRIYVIGPEGGIVTQFSSADDPDRIVKTLSTLMK